MESPAQAGSLQPFRLETNMEELKGGQSLVISIFRESRQNNCDENNTPTSWSRHGQPERFLAENYGKFLKWCEVSKSRIGGTYVPLCPYVCPFLESSTQRFSNFEHHPTFMLRCWSPKQPMHPMVSRDDIFIPIHLQFNSEKCRQTY